MKKISHIIASLALPVLLSSVALDVRAEAFTMDYEDVYKQATADLTKEYQKALSDLKQKFQEKFAADYSEFNKQQDLIKSEKKEESLQAKKQADIIASKLDNAWKTEFQELKKQFSGKYETIENSIWKAASNISKGQDIFTPGAVYHGKDITQQVMDSVKAE